MDAAFSFFKVIVDLGAAVMLPIVLIIIGLFFRMKLGQAIKAAGLVESGVEAKIVIQDGEVKVNGVVETQRGKKLFGGEVVEYNGSSILIKK